jgi:ribosomal protein S18 acetylase RimI-like enzyme
MNIPIELAEESDLPAIVALMNAAFRGTSAKQSWNVEAFITGSRTTESLLREEIGEGVQYLVAKEEASSALQGCVSLQVLSPERWYLGALTVDPALQSAGFGSRLLVSAEEYAVARGAGAMEITVVNVREALIAWYERRGYRLTGETRPFPYGDDRVGTPTRDDLEFVVLEKDLVDPDR